MSRRCLTGSDITEILARTLSRSPTIDASEFSTRRGLGSAQQIKESMCLAAPTREEFLALKSRNELPSPCILANGRTILVGTERYEAVEALFNPADYGYDLPSLPQQIYECVMNCPIDWRRIVRTNIALFGGTAMIPNLRERLHHELSRLWPASASAFANQTRIIELSDQDRMFSVWGGGSIKASLTSNRWITREMYNEFGPSVAERFWF
jgi:actin-related protein